MKNHKAALVAVLVVGSIAYAAALEIRTIPQVFRAGFWSGTTAAKTAGNKVTGVYEGSLVYDFGASTIECDDSSTITLTGAQVGDPCFVGIDDQGAAAVNSSFTCYATANGAVVRHCPAGTASNPLDAGYRVRVISSR